MQQVKAQLDELKTDVGKKIEEVRSETITNIKAMKSRLQSMDDYMVRSQDQKARLNSPFDRLIENVNQQKLIAVINDTVRLFEEQEYQKLLATMVEMASPKPKIAKPADSNGHESGPKVAEPEIEYISTRKIRVSFDKAWLANESDVDQYLRQMREALLKEIREGKRIQI